MHYARDKVQKVAGITQIKLQNRLKVEKLGCLVKLLISLARKIAFTLLNSIFFFEMYENFLKNFLKILKFF